MTPQSDQRDPNELRLDWPALPTERQLGIHFALRAGCEYLWCLWSNQPHAERVEGWKPIELREAYATYPLQRFRIAGHDVVLLSRGKAIPGATHTSTGIPVRIDPELEQLLGLAPPVPEAPKALGAPAGQPTTKKPAAAA